MRYALLIYSDPANDPTADIAPDSPEMAAQMQKWFSYSGELEAAGAIRGGEALLPIETATTVRVRDGETVSTDGPFAETKEVLGGFYLIEAADLDEATAWAAKIPSVGYGSVEIRPLMEIPDQG